MINVWHIVGGALVGYVLAALFRRWRKSLPRKPKPCKHRGLVKRAFYPTGGNTWMASELLCADCGEVHPKYAGPPPRNDWGPDWKPIKQGAGLVVRKERNS